MNGARSAEPGPDGADWISRFRFVPPESSIEGVAAPSGEPLPSFEILHPGSGRHVLRVSLPFAPGTFPSGSGLSLLGGGELITPDVRVLTVHPGRPAFVRRALVTFESDLGAGTETARVFQARLAVPKPMRKMEEHPERKTNFEGMLGGHKFILSDGVFELTREGKRTWRAEFVAPPRQAAEPALVEVIEQGDYYLWVRLLLPDPAWPRILEMQADSLGGVTLRGHLQRMKEEDERAPDLGWKITGPKFSGIPEGGTEHRFEPNKQLFLATESERLGFPDAPLFIRGGAKVLNAEAGGVVEYFACRADEKVPHQLTAWRSAAFELSPISASDRAPSVRIPPKFFAPLSLCGADADLTPWKLLGDCLRFHRASIISSPARGDDHGNITGMPASGIFGMNRLNHAPAIFEEYYRSGDLELRDAALEWCDNFHDLTIWWGSDRPGEFGGTRYNNLAAMGKPPRDDKFMWRSNSAVNFCTKGYDSFLLAYEETGDPRMATALRWQLEYAGKQVHADHECRNIGDVADFVRLYEITGNRDHLDQALRLFRELRGKLSTGDLFSQSGDPLEADPPFIDDDEFGYKHPFAKPYIIGYALAGLPALARHVPQEPKLRDVIRAVADFVAASEDPTGGWRYPHPRSSRVLNSQGLEHAAQLARAAHWLEERGESIENLLDAIELALQSRILVYQKTGAFLGGIDGWERSKGGIPPGGKLGDLYKKPDDREASRDYAEGAVSTGGAPPEGVVYFGEVLSFYLKHRPAERLFRASPELKMVLDRLAAQPGWKPVSGDPGYAPFGMEDRLPAFNGKQVARMDFPLAYDPVRFPDFAAWRAKGRRTVIERMLTPPPRAEFSPVILASEDRGTYEARKIALNISADSRIPVYLLVPSGAGPFPAIVVLHDHGAHFSIGKEKVIRPFGVSEEVARDAREWSEGSYGGRFIGDELARRGYVVFAIDALLWGERGRKEGVEYAAQQELAANLLQLGMSWSGVITWDDLRSAEFVASLPEVDPARIGAVGLSMGSHRAWTLAALSDHIAAGAAICWMGTTEALMTPGNNQTSGQSAFSMLVPGLRNDLDYPDVASLACPKPMLFFNGESDTLFPVKGVQDAYGRMRRVWVARGAGDNLVTKIWPVPHVFNVPMQEEAFAWLDAQLRPGSAAR